MKSRIRLFLVSLLWEGARRKAARERPIVIAITGSVGKTSTKEAIADVLTAAGRRVLKTAGNLNTEIGVPLSLLGFSESPEGLGGWLRAVFAALVPPRLTGLKKDERPYYVLEYSADHPGDIAFLAAQLPLDIAVITAITPVHMGAYASFEDLVKEKRSLLGGLRPEGVAILNADDANLQKASVPVLMYGMKLRSGAGLHAKDISLVAGGLRVSLDYIPAGRKMDTIGKGQPRSVTVHTEVIGKQQLYPLLAAAAVGFREGIGAESIKGALEAYHLPNGRGRLIEGRKESTIVDDSYNSSPESLKAGLDMLRPFAQDRRVVAILGQMNELGDMAEEHHVEVARYAASRVDFLAVVGQYGQKMVAAAQVAGLPQSRCLFFDTPEHLIDKLDQIVQRKDVVYVKASQNGMRLERAVKALMEHPGEANNLLVRQTGKWAR